MSPSSLKKRSFSTNGKGSTHTTGVTLAKPHFHAHTRKYVSALITLEGLKSHVEFSQAIGYLSMNTKMVYNTFVINPIKKDAVKNWAKMDNLPIIYT